jgi:two-component system CheB/CheR fusion protein
MANDPDIELQDEPEAEATEPVPGLDTLLSYLHENRGFDFTGYKRTGLERRLTKRLRMVGLQTFDEYVDYLEVHPDEFDKLFNAILINATSFFRDPSTWELLVQEVVPQILEAKQGGGPIRVWSAGCATGQEACSVAMVLAEALGLEAFGRRVKIYATDMDEVALAQARQAVYSPKELANVPDELLARYFERLGTKYSLLKEARRSVIFGRHDLLHDAPISRIDLLLCRNTLMYFNADAQGRILSNLHFALAESGVLVLGKAEMLLTHSTLFAPLDLKRRVFTKVTHGYARGRLAARGNMARNEEARRAPDEEARLREAGFDAAPLAQIGLSVRGVIVVMNERAQKLLDMGAADIGRSIYETAIAHRMPSLRGLIDQAALERRIAQVSAFELQRSDGSVFLDVVAAPLADGAAGALRVHLSFVDVTAARRLQRELHQATQELGAVYEELQAAGEELETTNEELQSTVEELETTNEELQSTNEELETTNEELQSTNEELQGMNDTLRSRTGDLGRLNLYFESILASLHSAVIVLDLDLHVQVWSIRSTELWGLRQEEVIGKHFLSLDIGLPVEKLRGDIKACISGERAYQEVSIAANNRRGRAIDCAIKVSRLTRDGHSQGVILLMDETATATA